MLGVTNAKNEKVRKKQYLDLLKVTRKTVGYSEKAVSQLEGCLTETSLLINSAQNIADELKRYIEFAKRIIDQTERRIVHGESVPASEKVVAQRGLT